MEITGNPCNLNLPHTSMRDLWIHENDLIVATHGRSFGSLMTSHSLCASWRILLYKV